MWGMKHMVRNSPGNGTHLVVNETHLAGSRKSCSHLSTIIIPSFRQSSAWLPRIFRHCNTDMYFHTMFSTRLPPIFRQTSATAVPIGVFTLCFQQRFRQSSAWLPRIFRHCNADRCFHTTCSTALPPIFRLASAHLPPLQC